MNKFNFYHNPRCSKSREALQLLENNNIEFNTILYLEHHLTTQQIKQLLTKLNLKAYDLVRKKEELFTMLNLQNADEEQLITAMSAHPKLIERPILEDAQTAIIARPPSKILDFCTPK